VEIISEFNLDNHKLMYHPNEVSRWIKGEIVAPIYVEIGPINVCNHNCIFCGLDYVERDGKFLDKEVFIKNLKDMADFGVKSIMFSGSGEPLLHKNVPEFIEKAKTFGIDVGLTTNGVLLNPEKAKTVLPYLDWVKVSIDAGTKETYSKIHGCKESDFTTIINNLKFASDLKKAKNLKCTIGTQMLILKDNIDEIERLAVRVKEQGADYLVLKPYSQHPDSKNKQYIDLSKYNSKLIELSEKYTDEKFKLIYRKTTGEEIQKGKLDYDVCYGLNFFAIIDAHGNVVPCHIFHEKEQYYYGNINNNLFSNIWKSNKRTNVLNMIYDKGCKDCRMGCRLNFVNKYLNNIKNRNVKHINFI